MLKGRPANTRESVLSSLIFEEVGECVHVINYKPDRGKDGNTPGYYTVRFDGKRDKLHRLIFEDSYGPLEPKEIVRHNCDNRLCVNPAHLERGNYKDNIADMHERLRGIRLGLDRYVCRKGHNLLLPNAIEEVHRNNRPDTVQCVECRKLRQLKYRKLNG
jgi:hypothetical protein